MNRFTLVLIRPVLLGLVLAAWEWLPRTGRVNSALLPPLSDVLSMLVNILSRPQVQEAVAVTAGEVVLAFIIAVPLGAAIGVLAAVTVATACTLRGSITDGIARIRDGKYKLVSVEHPTGELSVELEVDAANPQNVVRAALVRTARVIMRGEVMVPGTVNQNDSAI